MGTGEHAGDRREEVPAHVALGANLGAAQETLRVAITSVASLPATRLIRRSSLYRTEAVLGPGEAAGASPQPDYINAVVEIATRLSAPALLAELQRLEDAAGRQRPYPNAPRTLDLDILLYGSARVMSERLTIPHARMMDRAFVLVPLAEIAPGLVSSGQLEAVADQAISRLDSPPI
jgi:2-amino-4-hydroxy-6-hydroxymethyldihydropteridine diphosphokinase